MKKNTVALAVYRSVKAANDDGSYRAPVSATSGLPRIPLAGRSGWDPFEVWRTRIHVVVVARGAGSKR
ncbi:MAG: hypothetical protein ACREUT_13325 [Steroidobacteraceae bacterium]